MKLPVDIKALIDETTNIKAASETPLSVSVYLDESAPGDVVAHVRNKFASSLPTVRMTIMYVGANFAPQDSDDIAVLVAGLSPNIGSYAADLRALGVPVMVVTTLPVKVAALAEEAGHPIPKGDLIYPAPRKEAKDTMTEDMQAAQVVHASELAERSALPDQGREVAGVDVDNQAIESVQPDEPIALDDDAAEDLDTRMGRWIVSVCRDKRLTYAIAFPFVRRPLARDAVQATAVQNAAVGLVPFLPGADLPIMTLNQAKMVLQIAAAYGQNMEKERLKELLAVIATAYFSRSLARQLISFIPVLGFAFRTGVAYGATTALGYAIIEYFEGGQNITGIANVLEKAVGTSSKLAANIREKTDTITVLTRK